MHRFAPFMDPSLTVKFYERTPEQQASLGFLVDSSVGGETETQTGNEALTEGRHIPGPLIREPHSSVRAVAGHRAIVHGKSEEVAAILSKYSSPVEVRQLFKYMFCIAVLVYSYYYYYFIIIF